jgi:hypothetical protein
MRVKRKYYFTDTAMFSKQLSPTTLYFKIILFAVLAGKTGMLEHSVRLKGDLPERICLLEYAPLKRRSTSTRLHGAVPQKAVVFVTHSV